MYQSVEGISLRRDMVEFKQFTQKMRTDLAKTLDSELELHYPAFMSYASTRCTSQWTAYHLEETWWSSDNPLKNVHGP